MPGRSVEEVTWWPGVASCIGFGVFDYTILLDEVYATYIIRIHIRR